MTSFVFDIGGAWYGLPVEAVLEVLPMAWVTPVPESPADITGVLDVRGQVVAVLDPARRLRVASRPAKASDFLVLATVAGQLPLAMRVDGVLGLVEGTLTPAPPAAEGPSFLAGLLRAKEGLVSVLELDRFLSPEVRAFAEQAGEAAGAR